MRVLVASRDVGAGATLRPRDLRVVSRPVGLGARRLAADVDRGGRPAGRVGRTPGRGAHRRAPGRAGRDARAPAGLVAAPVRVADADAVSLLAAGDVVDILAATVDGGAEARLVASGVRVLAVPRAAESGIAAGLGDGALLLLATTSPTAARLAAAAVTDRLSVVVRGE